MTSELDADTAVEEVAPGRFRAWITDRWNLGAAPNGGYLSMIATRAITASLSHPDPFSVTTHFLRMAKPGEAFVEVERVRDGKHHATVEARLIQDGAEILRTIAVLGDLTKIEGPTHVTLPAPALSWDECTAGWPAPHLAAISGRLEVRLAPGTTSWLDQTHSERAELGGWIRLQDGRAPDALSLVFFADVLPPPVLNLSIVQTRWVPTLELTVHVRARPSPGWLYAWFRTRALSRGYLESDGELWDSTGSLVAMSRQLARLNR
ncbi:MAG: thioesterase family protein [Ramlibacter sp.]|nr:thioesterase family protein [Ramlibacter sp.]